MSVQLILLEVIITRVVQTMAVLTLQKCRMSFVVASVTGQLRLFVSYLSKSCGTSSTGCLLHSHGEHCFVHVSMCFVYLFANWPYHVWERKSW